MSTDAPSCPRCNSAMRLRKGGFGEFWACSRYPICKGTVNVKSPDGSAPREMAPSKPPQLGPPPGAGPVGVHPVKFDRLDDYQRKVVEFVEGVGVVAASAGCHPANTKIMLASGALIQASEVRKGMRLMGMDGQPRTVLSLIQGRGYMFRVHPVKGAAFDVNDRHVLTLVGSKNRKIAGRLIDVEVRALTEQTLRDYKLFRVGVQEFENAASVLPLDPYFLGVLIGDGFLGGNSQQRISVSKPDAEIRACMVDNAALLGMEIRQYLSNKRSCPEYIFMMTGGRALNRGERTPLRVILEWLGLFGILSGERFIPPVYRTASWQDRCELLAGLLDTDGHYERGGYDYISKSQQLAEDVCFVARSLGLAAYLTPCQKSCQNGFIGDYFRVSISGDCTILPLRIPRKQAEARSQVKSVLRTGIKKIEPLGEGAFYGFTLDGDGRYLLGDFTVTHNSGKTHTLIQRTIYLLSLGEVPESLLLLAYNKDAAQTIRDRLAQHVHSSIAARVNIFTFHAWAYAVLRLWYPTDPRYSHTRILGGAGGKHPIELAFPVARKAYGDEDETSAWTLLAAADRIAENMVRLDVQDTERQVANAMGWLDKGVGLVAPKMPPEMRRKAQLYARFCREWGTAKSKEGVIDFTDMLCTVAWWIRGAPEQPHVDWLTKVYRHVMVDECQDTNPARHTIASFLGSKAVSTLYVGDLRQSLYSFVGAQPDIFHSLAQSSTFFTLPVNRRSTSYIVEAANAIAEGQTWNLGGAAKALPTNGQGEPIQVHVQENPGDEAAFILDDINTRVRRGLPLDILGANYRVIARTHALLAALEYAFVARGMPCRVMGSPGGIWGSGLGQEFLGYIEAIEGHPSWMLLKVANKPKRYCKKEDVRAVIQDAMAAEKAGQPVDLISRLQHHPSKGVQRLGLDLLSTSRKPWGARCLDVARWLGLDKDGDMEGGDRDRGDALKAILHHAQSLGSLRGIQDYRAALAKQERVPAVLLSTIHAAKGQEAKVVYVAGVRTTKLPHAKCESEDEERRVFYVAVTRAQEACMITTGGTPSRFLRELKWVEDLPEWTEGAAENGPAGGMPVAAAFGMIPGMTAGQPRYDAFDYENEELD